MKHSSRRRRFLVLAAAGYVLASLPAAGAESPEQNKTVGIALGGGGARGLAHVEMLTVLDELGIKPRLIAGTSMGAVMGALYASGHSAAQIKSIVNDALARESSSTGFFHKELLEWIHLVDPAINQETLLSSGDFIAFLHDQIGPRTFADLKIPLLVVAADIQRREQVILHEHELIPALEASIAFPGLFSPVVLNDRVLVDGGIVNPVPYDLLIGHCDITIAVDVAGRRTVAPNPNPAFFEVISESFQTMENSILQAKMKVQPPNIYVKPDLIDIHLLDFGKAQEIYRQARPAQAELRRSLQKLLL